MATPKEGRKAFQVEETSNPNGANPQQQIEKTEDSEKKSDNSTIETVKVDDTKKKNERKVSEMKDNKGVFSDLKADH